MTTRAAKAAMTKARNFPENTCPASRHAQQLAETLMGTGPTSYVTDDRQHSGESIAATVTALWQARDELTALRRELECWRKYGRAPKLSDPEMAETMARLKQRIKTDKAFARRLLNEAGIVGKDGKLMSLYRA